jgi:hypothetical protein
LSCVLWRPFGQPNEISTETEMLTESTLWRANNKLKIIILLAYLLSRPVNTDKLADVVNYVGDIDSQIDLISICTSLMHGSY